MGSSLVFSIDPYDANVTLLANSLLVDQKVIGKGFQYDILWKPVENHGVVDKYKFDIIGRSDNGHEIKFVVKTPPERIAIEGNHLVGLAPDYNLNSTYAQGIVIDWSDAISEGHDMTFDALSRTMKLLVGKAFSIDPTIESSITVGLAPASTSYSEGERRLVKVGSTLFAFYWIGGTGSINYEFSSDNGVIWQGKTSTGTGAINSDNLRWTIIHSKYNNIDRITLAYWKVNGANTDFYAKTYTVDDTILTLLSTDNLFSVANHSACSSGTCAAANGAQDSNGNIYIAYRYLKNGDGDYQYRVMKSTNGGDTWTTTIPETDANNSSRIPMVLVNLSSTKMLLVWAKFGEQQLFYRVFSGTSWGSQTTTTGTSLMDDSQIRQISGDRDSSGNGYVAFLTGGEDGTLRVAKWTNTGTFNGFQTVDSSRSHTLPSTTLSSSGSKQYFHSFSISGGSIWDNRIVPNGSWQSWVPFTDFNSPNQLTSPINYRGVMWKEGNNIQFTVDNPPHDEGEAGLYIWSRSTASGHREELSCQAPPNADRCKIPYYIDGSMTATGLSIATVSSEASASSTRINAISPYIGVQELSQTSIWDNGIFAANLLPGETASYTGSPLRHCTNPPFCTNHDDHNIKWTLKVNGDPSEILFKTAEVCGGIDDIPTEWDIDKTLGHEFYHMLSFDHAAGNDDHSIVAFNGYICTTGVEPVEQDVDEVNKKYPAGVS